MKRIRRILLRKFYFVLYRLSPERYKKQYPDFLRKLGVNIPEDYRKGNHGFIHPTVQLDGNDFSLISIGRNTTISADVIILTHDYSIVKGLQAIGVERAGRFLKPVSIGENCFIGIRSIILPGAKIGDNVIIAAGSVVSGVIPNNVVVGGVPAKPITSVEEWARKHLEIDDISTYML